MGSYGIGISRLVGAIIEASHDDLGIIWPKSVTPFHISLINLILDNKQCLEASEKLYSLFTNMNIDVLYDDRDVSIGKKFSDNDLIGFPFQLIIGPKGIKNNIIEIKERKTGKIEKLSFQESENFIINQYNRKI